MLDPACGIGAAGRLSQEGTEMASSRIGLAALEEQKRHPIVGARERVVDFERAPIRANRLVVLLGLRERDRHVLEDAEIGGVIAQGQPVRGEGGVVVALALEREGLVEIVEPLRPEVAVSGPPEEAFPEAHSRRRYQRLNALATRFLGRLKAAAADAISSTMCAAASTRDVLEVDWAFFGELCRALALRIWERYDPEIVVGIAKAGVIPGVVVASILQRDFASMAVTRDRAHARPTLVTAPPPSVQGRRVLVVDETCDSGDTMKLALAAVRRLQPRDVQSAVSFKTGPYVPDFYALATESRIVLPWDREVVVEGELVTRPEYAAWLRARPPGEEPP